MKIRWHKESRDLSTWFAETGGVVVAEAVMSGRSGVDNYPWYWDLTDAGVHMLPRLVVDGRAVVTEGVKATLRSVKETIDGLFMETGQ